VANTAWLNGKHTIFGEVTSGQDIIDRIANVVPKGPGDKPRTDIVIKKLTISKTA
jgi:peptidyl-prolyl cis-trans isomerase A (cyclophilin A)